MEIAYGRAINRRFALVCPYCGKVHPETRRRILTLFLVLLTALAAGLTTEVRAEPGQTVARRVQHARVVGVIEPTITPAAGVTPPPATEPAPPPSPTPLPIPKTGIIWNPNGTSIYLYSEPGQGILRAITNGSFVTLLDEFAAYGNLPWTRVEFGGETGWLSAADVHRLRFEGGIFSQVDLSVGAYLYTKPQGQSIFWLPPGTPLRFLDAAGSWAHVTALNGETGWVLLERLADDLLESR